MITLESSDKDILDYEFAPNATIRDTGTISFIGWLLNKVNGLDTYKAATQEILALAKSTPIGNMPEGEKVRLVKKLIEAGGQL
jgi:hypothetical protein